MLREIEDVRQFPDEGKRRWFADRDMDLIVWYPDNGSSEIIGYQLCYDKQESEHALTWYKERGFVHNRVDDGEVPFSSKMTPVLVLDGLPPMQKIIDAFSTASEMVETPLRDHVLKTLREYKGPV